MRKCCHSQSISYTNIRKMKVTTLVTHVELNYIIAKNSVVGDKVCLCQQNSVTTKKLFVQVPKIALDANARYKLTRKPVRHLYIINEMAFEIYLRFSWKIDRNLWISNEIPVLNVSFHDWTTEQPNQFQIRSIRRICDDVTNLSQFIENHQISTIWFA